jgi:sulfatase maturation enzyme AslB (radical SAM superfamily)
LQDNRAFIVDTNGDLFSSSDAYSPSAYYLNVFCDDLRMLALSSNWRRAGSEADGRIGDIGTNCEMFGLCDGSPVAEATPQELSNGTGADRCSLARAMYREIKRFADHLRVGPAVRSSWKEQAMATGPLSDVAQPQRQFAGRQKRG